LKWNNVLLNIEAHELCFDHTHIKSVSEYIFLRFSVPFCIFLVCAEGFVCAFAHPSYVFAVVTDTPQYFAVFSSTRLVGKVRTLFLMLLVYTWRFTWFTTSLASLRMVLLFFALPAIC
jgi:hypothetical protein